jgi:hypothetical protein
VTDLKGAPVSISIGDMCGERGENAPRDQGVVRDIVLWADHRAEEEANLINATGSSVLDYVGGTMSVRTVLVVIRREYRLIFARTVGDGDPQDTLAEATHARWVVCSVYVLWSPRLLCVRLVQFRLTPTQSADFTVTYRATTNLARSNCSLVCKTSFVPLSVEGSKGWNPEFLSKIGLEDLVSEKFKRIGGTPGEEGSMVLTAGLPVGQGLSEKAAEDLGLVQGTPVGSGVIDAWGSLSFDFPTSPDLANWLL